VQVCRIVVENDANSNLVETGLCFLAWDNLLVMFRIIIACPGTHRVINPEKKSKLNFSGNQIYF
jgi:hypothetical protein